ncbi:hypothetical protein F511_35984 [Dorcoceras hygrometricum]|uniref:Uncharacterized protein n=1 Tax=Dorcoceras hygrometricum TaxID=472368 RepID=A0A2Z7B7W0_9LAMI|nr:hypothetical protein F511_35984 [Dorcoceras hygrometricum]
MQHNENIVNILLCVVVSNQRVQAVVSRKIRCIPANEEKTIDLTPDQCHILQGYHGLPQKAQRKQNSLQRRFQLRESKTVYSVAIQLRTSQIGSEHVDQLRTSDFSLEQVDQFRKFQFISEQYDQLRES